MARPCELSDKNQGSSSYAGRGKDVDDIDKSIEDTKKQRNRGWEQKVESLKQVKRIKRTVSLK